MKNLFLPMVLAILILTACGGKSAKSANQELEITNPNKPIEVTAGSEFTITVKTNTSANLHWELADALDSNIVQFIRKDHISDNPSIASSSGKDVWRFRAVAPGQTTITLGYFVGMTEDTHQKPIYTIMVK